MAKTAKRRPPSSRSFTDILKIGLGLLEARIEEKASIQKQARAKGYKEGYAEARRLHEVTYACSICGKTMAVTSDNAKQAIKKYLEEHGWGHAACHDKKG
jgi:hypothetical protein